MEWIKEIIKEYVAKNQIKTAERNTEQLYNYFVSQGYSSVYLVCNALIADSESMRILNNDID